MKFNLLFLSMLAAGAAARVIGELQLHRIIRPLHTNLQPQM